jgi:hypothetical protein
VKLEVSMAKSWLEQTVEKIFSTMLEGHLRVHHTDDSGVTDRIPEGAIGCCDEVSYLLRSYKVDLIRRGSL